MADNTTLNAGTGGDVIATDDIGGVKHQLVKMEFGVDGAATQVSASDPLPVVAALPSGAATSAKQDTEIASLASIDGKITAVNTGAVVVSSSALPTGAATEATLSTLNGKVTACNTGAVVVSSSALPSGASTAAKQPALGTAGTASADVITVQGIASMTALVVDGSAVTQPVSNAGLTALNGAIAGTEVQVDVLTMPTVTVNAHAVTNAGTFAVQVDGAALTALQLIDDPVQVLGTDTYTEGANKGVTLGAVRRDADTSLVDTTNEFAPLQVDANGRLKVEAFSGETLPVSLTSTTVTGTVAVTQSGTWDEVGINDSGNSITVDAPVGTPVFVRLSDGAAALNTGSGTATGALRVELPTNGTGIVGLAAGTNGIGKLTANAGVTIGAVEIAAAQTLGTVTTVSTLTGGGVAHDSGDSGNPVKTGAKAITSLKTTTLVTSADRADNQADLDGALLIRNQFPLGDLLSERIADTSGTSTAFSNFGAVASTRNFVMSLSAFNSSAGACYLDIRDGTAGAVLYTLYLPAGGGAVVSAGSVPLFRSTANTALAYDVSAATTTVYINMAGFQSKL